MIKSRLIKEEGRKNKLEFLQNRKDLLPRRKKPHLQKTNAKVCALNLNLKRKNLASPINPSRPSPRAQNRNQKERNLKKQKNLRKANLASLKIRINVQSHNSQQNPKATF